MDTVGEDRVTEEAKSMPVPAFESDLNFPMHDVAGATKLTPIVKITNFICELLEPVKMKPEKPVIEQLEYNAMTWPR